MRITREHSCRWLLDRSPMFTCSLNGSATIAPGTQESTALKVWQGTVASRLLLGDVEHAGPPVLIDFDLPAEPCRSLAALRLAG
jgi:hypothetical protein